MLFILAGCGGGSAAEQTATRVVRGEGFSFEVPRAWSTNHTQRAVVARSGDALVSATTFPLLRPYRPSLFAAASRELDRVAAKLASQAGDILTERGTTTVDGKRVRFYEFGVTKIGFVLQDRREYQLLCRLPGGKDEDGACALLFSTFTVT